MVWDSYLDFKNEREVHSIGMSTSNSLSTTRLNPDFPMINSASQVIFLILADLIYTGTSIDLTSMQIGRLIDFKKDCQIKPE